MFKVPEDSDIFSVANDIYNSGFVKYSEPDFFGGLTYHTDTYYDYQFPLNNTNDTTADVDAPQAWSITTGNSNIVVAVIDDGVEVCYPDILSNNMIILDGSNFGSSASDDPDDPSPLLGDKHGQCCAGIIVAQHNSYGVRGIAPSCRIMPVRFDFGCSDSAVANAINFAVTNGADVLSCSWGWANVSVITDAISNAVESGRDGDGCVVVFSSGNDADHDGSRTGDVIDDIVPDYPSRVSVNYVITVAAADSINHVANYSTYSSYYLDIAAPSSHYLNPGQVFTTDRNVGGYNPDSNNNYWPNFGTDYQMYTGRFGGTSAACPLVAGIAALMLSVNSSLTAAEVFDIITSTADKVGGYDYNLITGKCREFGYGKINAYSAVSEANGAKKIALQNESLAAENNKDSTFYIIISPNPANPSTTISYTLPAAGNVMLSVYSVSGQKVATLVDSFMSAGNHAAVFDGSSLASGVYFYRLETKDFTKTGKMTLVK